MCTIRSSAETNWRWIETTGRSAAISTSTSSRSITSRELLAWTVVIEPSWPVFMACSMSMASGAAALADDDPVGPHPQGVFDQVADGVGPGPFDVGRLGLQRDHVLLVQLQLRRVFDGDDPLFVGDEAATAR